jgi:uncharacterized membrane protein
MLIETLWVLFITTVPMLEMQVSIPLGILNSSLTVPFIGTIHGFGLPWWYVFLLAVIANISAAVFGYFALDLFVHKILLRSASVAKFYHKQLERAQRKLHPAVEKHGWWGLVLFLALPFPGTGIYTGTLAAWSLGMDYKQFLIATIIGSILAGIVILGLVGGLHLLPLPSFRL